MSIHTQLVGLGTRSYPLPVTAGLSASITTTIARAALVSGEIG